MGCLGTAACSILFGGSYLVGAASPRLQIAPSLGTVSGRALARNGAVTMDTNTVGAAGCAAGAATPTPTVPVPTATAPAPNAVTAPASNTAPAPIAPAAAPTARLPSTLPNTGAELPPLGRYALLLGGLAVAVGLTVRRGRK